MSKTCSVEGCDNSHYGKGLCQYHYALLRRLGTIEAHSVTDLPGEIWRPSAKESLSDIYFSNFGRVKSQRKRNEALLKTQLVIEARTGQKNTVLMVRPGGCGVRVAPEVLRIFHGNPEGDTNIVYLDGNPENCRADNLQWYGRGYLIDKAIAMAEASDHELADCFLKFWHGDHAAINDWLISISDMVRGYIYKCLRSVGFPYHIEVDDMVQQSLTDIFMALYRGMFTSFDLLHPWVKSIAKAAYLRNMRLKGSLPIEYGFADGDTGYLPDWIGWCNPSAELQAIYNEECAC